MENFKQGNSAPTQLGTRSENAREVEGVKVRFMK
jgi:hypothetical protein